MLNGCSNWNGTDLMRSSQTPDNPYRVLLSVGWVTGDCSSPTTAHCRVGSWCPLHTVVLEMAGGNFLALDQLVQSTPRDVSTGELHDFR
jgi:hypothetical protein